MGIIFIIVLVIVVWALLAQGSGRGFFNTGTTATLGTTVPETPLEILNKRYARGEIDRAEYESRKRDLVS